MVVHAQIFHALARSASEEPGLITPTTPVELTRWRPMADAFDTKPLDDLRSFDLLFTWLPQLSATWVAEQRRSPCQGRQEPSTTEQSLVSLRHCVARPTFGDHDVQAASVTVRSLHTAPWSSGDAVEHTHDGRRLEGIDDVHARKRLI